MGKKLDLTGQVYGDLTVLEDTGSGSIEVLSGFAIALVGMNAKSLLCICDPGLKQIVDAKNGKLKRESNRE